VLDEVASSVAFDERWSVLQRELLDEPTLADAVLLALSAGVTFEYLRSLARAFGSDWDLIEDRVLPFPPPAPVPPDITDLLSRATLLAARRRMHRRRRQVPRPHGTVRPMGSRPDEGRNSR
jgi:ATP-dependent helicase/nuclease subunit A